MRGGTIVTSSGGTTPGAHPGGAGSASARIPAPRAERWYREIHDSAHLSPPPVTYPPLFVWHMVLWKNASLSKSNDFVERRLERLETIDQFLADLFCELSKKPNGKSNTFGVTDFTADTYREHRDKP